MSRELRKRRVPTYRVTRSLRIESTSVGPVFSWVDPRKRDRVHAPASPLDLLAVAVAQGRLSPFQAAWKGGATLEALYATLSRLDRKGVLHAPPTLLRRDPARFPYAGDDSVCTVTAAPFQWHITSDCDMNCRHCYDREARVTLPLEEALRTLDQIEQFCERHWIAGSIVFTGGNPFLHPGFLELYAEAVRRGFPVVVLGNPVRREQVEKLCEIRKPDCYQISLEGLREHNDWVRGPGSFDRGVRFLDVLRALGVPSCVMMTYTRANLDQALPLTRVLEGRADAFAGTPLSQVGSGAALDAPEPEAYRRFLYDWVAEARHNPALCLKDNLTNLVEQEQGGSRCGGCCTPYGCAAAFDAPVLLPDGEVHACRRLPSLLGNLRDMALEDIYQSEAAQRYRRGLSACDGCELLPRCGGCLAQARGASRDPYCWKHRNRVT